MNLVSNQNRKFPRQPLARPVEASLVVAGRPFESNIIDYSFLGFKIETSESALKSINRDKNDVRLSLGTQDFACRVCHSHKSEGTVLIGVNLPELARESALSFTTNDPGWDLIEDPETLQNLWSDLVFKGPEVLIDLKQIAAKATVIAKKMKEDNKLVVEIHELERGRISVGPASFQFEIFQTCHAFDARVSRVNEKEIELDLPKAIARLLRRETFRVLNGANGKKLEVELSSSVIGKSDGALEVYDFSEHGISVLDPSGWIFAPPGVPIDSVTIRVSGGSVIQAHGTIRGYRWIAERNTYAVGLKLETSTDSDRTKWHNMILEARYPALSLQYGEADHGAIWDLFHRSGYLDVKPGDAITHMVDLTRKTWTKLSDSGTKISKRAVIRSGDTIVGHIQMDRIYPDTWCVHHLAIDPKVSKLVGKEIYSAVTDVLLSEGARYLLSYADSRKPWNQRNYYDFIEQYRFKEHQELKTYELYEADIRKGWNLKSDSRLQIRPATKYDLRRITHYFELYSSPLEQKTCALTSEDLELKGLNQEIAPFGLMRKREFLIATLEDKFLGFVRVELGTPGVNIFGLLDMIYIHLMPNLGVLEEITHETLLDAGLSRFRDLERRDVVIVLEDNRREYYVNNGLAYIFAGNRWIAQGVTFNRYQAFSQMLYGHLLFKRGRIRERVRKD